MVQFRRDWIAHMEMMQQEMNRLLDHLAGSKPPMVRFSPSAWEPAIDVYETDDEVVVTVELAGVKESDMEILVDRDTFIIRGGRRKALRTSGKRAYHQMEITSGPFEKSVTLPVTVDTTNIKASYEGGLVEVLLPKATRDKTLNVKIRIG